MVSPGLRRRVKIPFLSHIPEVMSMTIKDAITECKAKGFGYVVAWISHGVYEVLKASEATGRRIWYRAR